MITNFFPKTANTSRDEKPTSRWINQLKDVPPQFMVTIACLLVCFFMNSGREDMLWVLASFPWVSRQRDDYPPQRISDTGGDPANPSGDPTPS